MFFIRPLIDLQKRYIEELCRANSIPYFTDVSNKNSSLTIRNALRNDLFPQMMMLSSQNKWYDSWSLIYSQIERAKQRLESDNIFIVPRQTHPSREAEYCYEIKKRLLHKTEKYTQTDRMFIFQKLGIHKNISQKTLAERERFSNTSKDGYKLLA